jgi:thiamine biosynthesis lipoprotein
VSPQLQTRELSARFSCFGGDCGVWVTPEGKTTELEPLLTTAKRRLLTWHEQFTRFAAGSELSRLNKDPRPLVPISPMMARLIEAVIYAGELTGGLVDATLLHQIEKAGYRCHHEHSMPLELSLGLTAGRAAAKPARQARWSEMRLARRHRQGTVC